jgi:hypothetical protein
MRVNAAAPRSRMRNGTGALLPVAVARRYLVAAVESWRSLSQ